MLVADAVPLLQEVALPLYTLHAISTTATKKWLSRYVEAAYVCML